jgi:hypothetical protein
MHKFSRESMAFSSWKFLNLDSLKCHFLDFGERFYRILMVRKRHCNISEALANVFAYRLSPGAPIWPIGVGGPRVLPVWAHSSYATETHDFRQSVDFYSFHMRTGFESHWESSHWDLNLRPQPHYCKHWFFWIFFMNYFYNNWIIYFWNLQRMFISHADK